MTSYANILEQERSRSTITEPLAIWFDDFMTFLNPDLDQCCKFKKGTKNVFPPSFTPRHCETCFECGEWDHDMTGFSENGEFMEYFNMWIDSPSDPCPLGGKAPYAKAISYNKTNIIASTFRKAHRPLNSQADFISAYLDAKLIASSVEDIEVFAYSPFYIYYVQYESMVYLTMKLLGSAVLLIFIATTISLGSIQTAAILSLTILMILIDIGAVITWSNITLNAVSLVNLIICVGLAVEF